MATQACVATDASKQSPPQHTQTAEKENRVPEKSDIYGHLTMDCGTPGSSLFKTWGHRNHGEGRGRVRQSRSAGRDRTVQGDLAHRHL